MSETQWCSQSEAARRLKAHGDDVSQPQISRYLDAWPEIPRRDQGAGQPMLVDFEALRAHRAENVLVQERQAAKTATEPDESADLRLRERRAAAELRELELARARDELIPRASVLRAVQAAALELQQAHRRTRFERAEALEATRDARAKVVKLEEQDGAIESAFARALSSLASAASPEDEDQHDEEREANAANSSAPAAPTAPSEPPPLP